MSQAFNLWSPELLSYLNGTGGKALGDIAQKAYLNFLSNIGPTVYSLRAPQSGDVETGASIYKIPLNNSKFRAYNGNPIVTDIPKQKQVQTGSIYKRVKAIMSEYFDEMINHPSMFEKQVNIDVLSAALDLKVFFYNYLKAYAEKHPEQGFFHPYFANGNFDMTQEQALNLLTYLNKAKIDLARTYNAEYFGMNPNRFLSIIDSYLALKLSKAQLFLNQSIKAYDLTNAMINNGFNSGVFNPNNFLQTNKWIIDETSTLKVDNPNWGEYKDANDNVVSFDMSDYAGFIYDYEFLVYNIKPVIAIPIVPTTNNGLNRGIGNKWANTACYLRPKAFIHLDKEYNAGIVNDLNLASNIINTNIDNLQDNNTIKVGKTYLGKSNYFAGDENTTITSSDSSIVSVSGKTISGVAAGTATLTFSTPKPSFAGEGNYTKEITVTVEA